MDFELSEEQEILSRSAESFAKQSPITRFRKVRDQRLGFDPEVWRQMAELGWLSLPFPEAAGGLGGSVFDASLIVEKLGATLVPEPFVESVILAGTVLAVGGDDEQRTRFLAPMTEGKTTLALAYLEGQARYDASNVRSEAVRSGDGYVLTGSKRWVPNGYRADHFIVTARVGDEFACFVVDRGAANLQIVEVNTIDGRQFANLELRGVTVSSDRRLTRASLEVIQNAVDRAAALCAAEAVGISKTVLEMTVDYLKTREQFGVKIGSFQALQHRTVDMFVELELLRSIALEACVRVDASDSAAKSAVSAAKIQLARSGKAIVQSAVQLHGGIGITDEHDVGLYFKRMTALLALYGDEEEHVRRYATVS